MATWHDENGVGGVVPPRVQGWGWARVAWRAFAMSVPLIAGIIIIVLTRLPERVVFGAKRPLTGPVVQRVCRMCLFLLGIRWRVIGQPMRNPGPVVANHSSWLDILVLNAAMPVFFVAKAEVRRWPGINILTAVTNTHFITRDPRRATDQAAEFAARTRNGHRLLFFPEGTSSDSRRVLPFKPTLFQAFVDPNLPANVAVQPVAVAYRAPVGRDPRFYAWWSNMAMGPHLLSVLAQKPQGCVTVVLYPPIPAAGETRKTLATKAETTVRAGVTAHLR